MTPCLRANSVCDLVPIKEHNHWPSMLYVIDSRKKELVEPFQKIGLFHPPTVQHRIACSLGPSSSMVRHEMLPLVYYVRGKLLNYCRATGMECNILSTIASTCLMDILHPSLGKNLSRSNCCANTCLITIPETSASFA